MKERMINSFGSIVIPIEMRQAMGISGSCTLWVGVRENIMGEKEIVIKKSNDLKEYYERYKTWSEVLSSISDCTVALVLGNRIVSLSDGKVTDDFINKEVVISPLLYTYLQNVTSSGVLVTGKDSLSFLANGSGEVVAFFAIRGDSGEKGYFVLVRGTKYDKNSKISKPEMQRRLDIIHDIVAKI